MTGRNTQVWDAEECVCVCVCVRLNAKGATGERHSIHRISAATSGVACRFPKKHSNSGFITGLMRLLSVSKWSKVATAPSSRKLASSIYIIKAVF
jgi:hypothetical protein